ncbi:MAG TPA: TPM domain-containing protein [Chitinophagaceae bacterium]|nr:TPM domain-containing protein [Chitinophagaceae bacterium]
MLSFSKKKTFFTIEQQKLIVDAVQQAEKRTSGEVRVFVESRCKYMDAIDRAYEIFFSLKMNNTADRNAVLLYVALKDRQLAIFADEGIHSRLGQQYWNDEISKMIANFNREDYADGIRKCVISIGEALYQQFPFDNDTDKNELPDDIVFGN